MRCCFISLHGVLCFEKTGETPADDARLRHEGWILALAAHPGVVTLMDGPIRSGGWTLVRTRGVRGRPLAAMDGLSASEVAGLGAAVATTVADLHDAGITHGRPTVDHIVVDTTGRPVLCGFAQATAARCSPPPAVTADVRTLSRTLASLLATGGESHPGRPRSERSAHTTDSAAATLVRVLDDIAAAGTGDHRGSARRLAERLADRRFAPSLPSRARRPVPG